MTLHAEGYRKALPPSFINEYAAMPSFHAGWNLLLGIELFRVSRNVALRAFAVLMPMAMAFSVVATANHFVLDVFAGAGVVVTALLLVTWHEKRANGASRVNPHVPAVHRRPPRAGNDLSILRRAERARSRG